MQENKQKFTSGNVNYYIGQNSLKFLSDYLKNINRFFILVDENTEVNCLPVLNKILSKDITGDIIQIKSGEGNKNLNTCNLIWEKLTNFNADRDNLVINLGGGVITDIGGFTASTYKRGMKFINIPTTLLGQVDAAIGGKTGVDFKEYKNHIGLFSNPESVFIDPVFLNTLNKRQLRSGFAEILKYAFIMDPMLTDIINNRSFSEIGNDWGKIIHKSAIDKITVVEKDEKENGFRKILNFGHTIGHALETWFLKTDNPITHGEAVAAGMICETWLSHEFTGLKEDEMDKIISLIDKSFERIIFKSDTFDDLLSLTKQDKKVRGGSSRYSLLKSSGEAVFDIPVEDNWMLRSLEFYIMDK